jgi:hypothetical protein
MDKPTEDCHMDAISYAIAVTLTWLHGPQLTLAGILRTLQLKTLSLNPKAFLGSSAQGLSLLTWKVGFH